MRKLKLNELDRLSPEEYKLIDKIQVVLILDNIRSGMNVGSLFRTSDAYAIERIVLCGITAKPPHREILKTAIGATDSVDWTYVEQIEEALSELKRDQYKVLGIEQTTDSIMLSDYVIEKDQSYAIVLGNEVRGISDVALPQLDSAIEIQQYGTKHSLNVSVCGGIVLHHFSTQLR